MSSIQATLLLIDDILKQDKFTEALGELQAISVKLLSGVEAGYYHRLLGETLLFLGRNPEGHLDSAVGIFKKTDNHFEYANAKYLKGWQLQREGRFIDAKETLIEAYASSLRADDLAGSARALNRLAAVCHHLGQADLAIEHQLRSIALFEKNGDTIKKSTVALNLSLTLFRLGRFNEAEKKYIEILREVSALSIQNQITYYLGSSLLASYRNHPRTAEKGFNFIKKNIGSLQREEAIYYEYLGWAKILEGDYKAAEIALKTGLKLSFKMGDSTTLISQTKRLLADVYIATDRIKLAEQTALEALSVAEKIGERLEIAASWRVLAQTAAHFGSKNEATGYFYKAIDLFSQIGYKFELAYTRYLAACSGMYTQAEASVMLHLAGEYFVSENLTEYVKRVETAERSATPQAIASIGQPKATSVVIIAESRKMKRVMELAQKAAPTSFTILLTGQTGTGKDLLARYMHDMSGRTGPFVQFNAAAVQPTLAESVLFGTVKGVFTDAVDRAGLFEAAENGTFFLNEIGNASLELQSKLLDVLETHMITRVGESTPRRVNFRLIAATNANLEEMIKTGTFRADLYHRLRQIPMHIPPLDERKEDITALTAYFLKDMSPQLGDMHFQLLCSLLTQRTWLGNARELKSELDKLWITSNGSPDKLIQETERLIKMQQMRQALSDADGNCLKAARALDIDESTLRYWLKQDKVEVQ